MKTVRKILPLIGIIILIYVITKVGLDDIINAFKTIKWVYIILSIAAGFIIAVLQAWKWDVIIKRQGIYLPFLYVLKVQMISTFYGNITPGRVGSFVKVLYLKEKTNKNFGNCISSVTLERFFDLFMVSLFAFFGSIIALKYFPGIFWELLIIFMILVMLLLISINKKLKEFLIMKSFDVLVPSRFKDRAKTAFVSFHDSLLKPSQVALPIIATIVTWIAIYAQMYLVALALSLSIPFFQFIFISSIGTMVSLIPITIGGIGTTEASLTVLYYKIFGINPPVALSLALINRFIGLVVALIGGIISLIEEKYL